MRRTLARGRRQERLTNPHNVICMAGETEVDADAGRRVCHDRFGIAAAKLVNRTRKRQVEHVIELCRRTRMPKQLARDLVPTEQLPMFRESENGSQGRAKQVRVIM